jgi:hypothetical protein
VTTTARPFARVTPTLGSRPCATSTGSSDFPLRLLRVVLLESCHSTWIFDPRQLEFCRILKGVEVGSRPVATTWRPYWQVQLDSKGEGFTVYLNAARTRQLRSWRHTKNCGQCAGSDTAELSLEEIHLTLHGYRV